jgi:hypothetical protein
MDRFLADLQRSQSSLTGLGFSLELPGTCTSARPNPLRCCVPGYFQSLHNSQKPTAEITTYQSQFLILQLIPRLLMSKMLNSLRENSGKIGMALAVLTLAWSSISAYVSSSTHLEDVQAQQERRIADLESQVRNDLATRREIQDFKAETVSRFDRIEGLLTRELEFQHGKRR